MVHPQERRARAWAERHRLPMWRPFGELPQALAAADLVVSALDLGAQIVISADMVQGGAEGAAGGGRCFLIDCGVPGDIDARIDDLDDAFLYDSRRSGAPGDGRPPASRQRGGRRPGASSTQAVAAFRAATDGAGGGAGDRRICTAHFEQQRAEVLAAARHRRGGGDAAPDQPAAASADQLALKAAAPTEGSRRRPLAPPVRLGP